MQLDSFATVLWTSFVQLAVASPIQSPPIPQPLVKLQNGTLVGLHSPVYNQDFFLGVPYASPPVGDLRLRLAVPPTAWNNTLSATSYGPWCYGNSVGLLGYSQVVPGVTYSEDCLHMNIIRPSGIQGRNQLPVLVWIPGGAGLEGSANEPRYNGSFIVQNSVDMNMPILFVSLSYRLGPFGMLAGSLLEQEGLANIGLYDQRQALAWIQENISQFGGDPSRVTIMGESAGATSVGFHLLAYRGRNDDLFSGAIAESGGPYAGSTVSRNSTKRDADFNMVLEAAKCGGSRDPLSCLRNVPAESLNAAGAGLPVSWVVDGRLLPNQSLIQLDRREFVRVPLLIGSNRNEGTSLTRSFAPFSINSDEDFVNFIQASWTGGTMSRSLLQTWSKLYQQEVDHPTVAGLGTVAPNPGPDYGAQYGKTTLWTGDMIFTAGRRFASQAWAAAQVSSYSYFFDTVPASVNATVLGAAHFQEIPYVFNNADGVGWDGDPFPTDPILRKKHERLVNIMSRMWISFAVMKSPNFHKVADLDVVWPAYSLTEPKNIVFSATEGIHLQQDDWRVEAIELMKKLPNDVME